MTKEAEDKVLKVMFGNDSKEFAGFHNVVFTLLNGGTCLTTTSAKEMYFLNAHPYITYKDVDRELTTISFDRVRAVRSESFKTAKNKVIECITNDIEDLTNRLRLRIEELDLFTGEE